MARLSLALLGPLLVRLDDQPITSLAYDKVRALLAYLTVEARPHGRDALAELLWPDQPPSAARRSLRVALTTLRQALGETTAPIPFLIASRESVQVNPASDISLDLTTFDELLRNCQPHAHTGGTLCPECAVRLSEAVALYRGEFLQQLVVRDSAAFDEWLTLNRERLHRQALEALAALAAYHEGQGEDEQAREYAWRSLALEPWNEVAHCCLMRVLSRKGQRSAALAQYERCRKVLEQELGVEPSAETIAIYEQIRTRTVARAVAPTAARSPASASHQEQTSRPGDDRASAGPPTPLIGREAHEPLAHHAAPATRLAPQPTLVGRTQEWAQLQAAWRAASEGRPQVVVLAGEAGIGKTRLAEELCIWVSWQGLATAMAHCYAAEGALAYAPLTAWLRSDALRRAQLRLDPIWLSEVARLLPELLIERPELPRPAPLTEDWQRQRFREALARAVLSGPQPLLLLLDDLQWCDHETLEWLHFLLRSDLQARLLLLGTVRSEELSDEHPLTSWLMALRRGGQVREIELAPLDAATSAALAAQVLGRALDSSLAAQLYAETEGNPLFVVETVRAGSASDAQLGTSTIHSVIATRLAQLSAAARDLVHTGATIGRSFTVEVLARASDRDEEALVRGLDELWQRRIVREQGENAYDFSHDKIREVAYGEMSAARRRLLHRRVAAALEAVYAHDLDALSGQIASHYEQAGVTQQAVQYYQRAATVARGFYANDIALAHLNKGLALVKNLPDTPDRIQQELELQVGLAAALIEIKGGAREVEQAYNRAFELGQHVRQPILLFPVLWGLHQVYQLQGKADKAREMAEQSLRLAQEAQDPALLLEAHHAMWAFLFHLSPNELPLAVEHAEQGIALYDLHQHHSLAFQYGGHDPGICSRNIRARALWLLGYPDLAVKQGQETIDLGYAIPHPPSLSYALINTAIVHIYRREARAVAELATAAIAIATERDLPYDLADGMVLHGWAMTEQGDVEQGIVQMRQGIADWRAKGAVLGQPRHLALLAEAYQKAGQADQGLAALSEALAAIHASGEGYFEAEIYRLTGELLLAAGQPDDQAESSYHQALQVARQQRTKSLELRAAVSLSRLWQRQGRYAKARHMLAAIYDWFSEGFDTPDLKEARSLLDHL